MKLKNALNVKVKHVLTVISQSSENDAPKMVGIAFIIKKKVGFILIRDYFKLGENVGWSPGHGY